MTSTKAQIDNLADEIIQRLREHVIIHRYNAYSTNSVYLKFDYGVANSLRISDHDGKRHLKYRYNLLLEQAGNPVSSFIQEGFTRRLYPPEAINQLVHDILADKETKKDMYYNYEAVVKAAKARIDTSRGFWANAKQIN